VQLLDLPGIVEGAAMGRGRGRQVVSVAKTADVIVIMSESATYILSAQALNTVCRAVDATKSAEQRRLLEAELEAVGIRLNTKAPDGKSSSWKSFWDAEALLAVVFRQKAAGGVSLTLIRKSQHSN
jgi:ribosome-interacting GTPase 1